MRKPGAVANQILDCQIIAIRPAVLEVGDGIDANHIGYLPGRFCKRLDGIRNTRTENRLAVRLDIKKNVVVLGVGILEIVECHQLRVLRGEERPVVGGEPESR